MDAKSWTDTIIWTIQAAGFVAIAIFVAIILQCSTLTKLQLTRYVENCISVRWYLSCLYAESFIALPCAMPNYFSVSCIKNLYPA